MRFLSGFASNSPGSLHAPHTDHLVRFEGPLCGEEKDGKNKGRRDTKKRVGKTEGRTTLPPWNSKYVKHFIRDENGVCCTSSRRHGGHGPVVEMRWWAVDGLSGGPRFVSCVRVCCGMRGCQLCMLWWYSVCYRRSQRPSSFSHALNDKAIFCLRVRKP